MSKKHNLYWQSRKKIILQQQARGHTLMPGILWESSRLASFLFSCWCYSPVFLGLSHPTNMRCFSADNSFPPPPPVPHFSPGCLFPGAAAQDPLEDDLWMNVRRSMLLFWLAKVVCKSNRKNFEIKGFISNLSLQNMKLASPLVNFWFSHQVPSGIFMNHKI